jgi:hypothetical protein
MYPAGFFAIGVTPSSVALSAPAAAVSGASSDSSIVITLQHGTVSSNAAVVVTLNGLTVGHAPLAGGSVSVSTSQDQIVSASTASGWIGGAVTNVLFEIANSDRVVSKAGVPVTFSFSPSAGGALFATDTITLMYPNGFFSPGVTPSSVSMSGYATAVSGSSSESSIVITLSSFIASYTHVCVTLNGLTLGKFATFGGAVTVSTSTDLLISESSSSGYIFIGMSVLAICIVAVLLFFWFVLWYCRRRRPNGFWSCFGRDQGWRLL